MVAKRQCSFCADEIEPGTGLMFVKRDGTVFHFCSSSCRKQQLHLGRVGHRVKWTRAHAVKRAQETASAPPPIARPSPPAPAVAPAAPAVEASPPEERPSPGPSPPAPVGEVAATASPGPAPAAEGAPEGATTPAPGRTTTRRPARKKAGSAGKS